MPDYPYQVTFAAGNPTLLQGDGNPASPEGQLVLAPMATLDLTGGCTIYVGSYALDGGLRVQDGIGEATLNVETEEPDAG